MTMSKWSFLSSISLSCLWFSPWRLCWSRLEAVIRKVSNVLSSTSPVPLAPGGDGNTSSSSLLCRWLAASGLFDVENNVNQMAAERAKSMWNNRKKTATSLTKVVKAQQHWRIRTIMLFILTHESTVRFVSFTYFVLAKPHHYWQGNTLKSMLTSFNIWCNKLKWRLQIQSNNLHKWI